MRRSLKIGRPNRYPKKAKLKKVKFLKRRDKLNGNNEEVEGSN